jgi:molybdopterin molybdotransferase
MNTKITGNNTGCDSNSGSLLSVADAKQRIHSMVQRVTDTEKRSVTEALDRILAEDIISEINVPPYNNSAMDGYAVNSADLQGSGKILLQVVGSSFAGNPYDGEVKQGQCIRIMTGAIIPEGTDTVIMQEAVQAHDDKIETGSNHHANENVRFSGEDIRKGDTILSKGKKLGAAELGILASLGIADVTVFRKIKVAFFSTGDELRNIGEPLGTGQIYDSNRYTLTGMLRRMDVDLLDLGIIPDQRNEILNTFKQAASQADAIITTGGVSVGEADYVKSVLEEIGEVNFWRVAMKPGKPMATGTVKNAFFFGLPGNPVSAMATFYQFVRPALLKMSGNTDTSSLILKLPCVDAIKKQPGRLEYQRGIIAYDEHYNPYVTTTGLQDSHILTSMSKANCFIILPAECGNLEEGSTVEVQPFMGLI